MRGKTELLHVRCDEKENLCVQLKDLALDRTSWTKEFTESLLWTWKQQKIKEKIIVVVVVIFFVIMFIWQGWLSETWLCVNQSVGKTDEDYEVDDALLDRAAHKQSQSHIESRERQLAVIGAFDRMFLYFNKLFSVRLLQCICIGDMRKNSVCVRVILKMLTGAPTVHCLYSWFFCLYQFVYSFLTWCVGQTAWSVSVKFGR